MPPRYAYWTILAGGLPTAFRAASRDELAPTFNRLRERHPDAVLKWFARGKLWDSPEEARQDRATNTPPRGPDWRPGGDHRDRRQNFRDAKLARNQARRSRRFERKHPGVPTGDAREVPAPSGHAPPKARRPTKRSFQGRVEGLARPRRRDK
jgi:hypothetical protein